MAKYVIERTITYEVEADDIVKAAEMTLNNEINNLTPVHDNVYISEA